MKSFLLLKPGRILLVMWFLLFGWNNFRAYGQVAYPHIKKLKSNDYIFKQFQEEVQYASRKWFSHNETVISFYTYLVEKDDDLMSIAARCSLRQDSLSSLNSISFIGDLKPGTTLVIPVLDGIFVRERPVSNIDYLLSAQFRNTSGKDSDSGIECMVSGVKYTFYPQEKFTPSLRGYFLNPGMILPLEKATLTSSFGMRTSPISGKWKFHKGIDLAAPLGSSILACKSGVVRKVERSNSVYGNFVVIDHFGGYESLYAHMSDVLVVEGQRISSGQKIGYVGLTGMTTGPHLHFELKQNGKPIDPQSKIRN